MSLKLLGALLISVIAAEELSPLIEFGEENLQLYKRSAKHARAAHTYDTTKVIKVNKPVDSSSWGHQRCWNTAVFAVVSAVEISYTLATGIVKKFSEQELIDCFYRGCHPANAASIIRSLIVNDRLAQSDNYTPYQAQSEICRAALAPDGLDKVKITDVFSVSVDDVEDAIREHGSVIACMDLSSAKCPMYRTYKSGVINGRSVNSCNHVVNIVGYTKYYYKVKEHRGSSWGEGGYFRVARGGNACGVEYRMVAISVSKREGKKPLASNGCPLSAPVYCKELKTCTTASEACVEPKSTKSKRSLTNPRIGKCADYPSYPCARYKKYCDSIPSIAQHCLKTCDQCPEEEEYTGSCKDDPKVNCPSYTRFCGKSPAVRLKCPRTCKLPDSECQKDQKLHPSVKDRPKPSKGKCYVPDIPNGRVSGAKGGMLENGAELKITCDKGYVLVGQANYCGVQKVYGNDSRLMQSCMKINSEEFTSNGYDYQGMATDPVSVSSNVTCDNWNELIVRGKFHVFTTDVAIAKSLMFGNHQFCRNNAALGQPVPFCFVGYNTMAYCKKYPGCEVCEDGVKDLDSYCEEDAPVRCPYSSEYKLNRNKDAWKYCKQTCCSLAGCV